MEKIPSLNLDDDMSSLLSNEMFKSSNKPMLYLFVDMETMFDYKLAALFKMIKTETEFAYLKKRMFKYKQYKGRLVTKCFPALKFTEDQVLDFIKDPANLDYLSTAGLITNISNLIPAQISLFSWVNKNSPLYENEPITIIFNNNLFLPNEASRIRIVKSLTSLFPNIKCTFTNSDIRLKTKEELLKIDHFILDNFKEFLDEKYIPYKMLFMENSMMGSVITATYQFEEDTPWLAENDPRIKETIETLNNFCCFNFFDKQLFLNLEDS